MDRMNTAQFDRTQRQMVGREIELDQTLAQYKRRFEIVQNKVNDIDWDDFLENSNSIIRLIAQQGNLADTTIQVADQLVDHLKMKVQLILREQLQR
jgi:hypothetical protein